MWITTPDSAELVQDTVVAIEALEAEGLFNPFTNAGPFVTSVAMITIAIITICEPCVPRKAVRRCISALLKHMPRRLR